MTIIELSGEIGWDIWPKNVSEQLKKAGSDDLMVRFSSIGGSVFDGSDIMTLFVDHKRDNPGIKMDLELKAVAASMGSAIAASPVWDSVGVDSTTGYMIHNPSSLAWGDFRELQSMADFLSSMRSVYSDLYSSRSGKSKKEIESLMDSESWFFGQGIVDNGFADKVITSEDAGGEPLAEGEEDNQDENIIIFEMKKKLEEMKKHQKEVSGAFDKDRAVACLSKIPGTDKKGTKLSDDSKKTAPVQKGRKTEVPEVETKAELMKELPEVYAESKMDGVKTERERVAALMALKQKEEYKGIPEVVQVIDTAIEEGNSPEEVQPLMMAAMVKIMKDPARVDEIESPGDIQGGDQKPENPAMKKQTHLEV